MFHVFNFSRPCVPSTPDLNDGHAPNRIVTVVWTGPDPRCRYGFAHNSLSIPFVDLKLDAAIVYH